MARFNMLMASAFDIAYNNGVTSLTVIPEPAVLSLIGIFGGGLLFGKRFFT